MLKDFADGFAFVIGAMSALSDLFEDGVLQNGQALRINCHCGTLEAPRLQNHLNEVVLLVNGRHSIAVSVVANEIFFTDVTILALLAHDLNEIVHYGLCALFARCHSWMGRRVVLRDKGLEGNRWGTLRELLPSLFDYSEAVSAHISLFKYERIDSSASVSENHQVPQE